MKPADVQKLMQLMLAFPQADHSSAVRILLPGGLRLGHAIGIYRASKHFSKSKVWLASMTSNGAVALHVWLYHFMGAAAAKLLAADAANMPRSNALRIACLREEESYTVRVRALLKARGRAAAAGQSTAAVELELADLRGRDLPPSVLPPSILEGSSDRGAASSSDVAAAPAPESPPPPGSSAEWQHTTNRLLAFAMGTHSRLGEGYSSRDGPCASAVRLVAGHEDVLRQIAARVRNLPPRTLAPPDRETLRLRRLLWQLEQELHAERSASKELRVQLSCSERELAHSARREEGAAAAFARALELAHAMAEQAARQLQKDLKQLKDARTRRSGLR